MNKIICLLVALLFTSLPTALGQRTPARERTSFNAGWRFQKDDPRGAEGVLSYDKIKESAVVGSSTS
jgi:hypothetical protein